MKLCETNEIKARKLGQDGDSFLMKVPVLQADVENANRRRYSFAVVKAAVEDLSARLKKRSTFGSTRHEKELEVDQVSHVVEAIELDEKGLASAVLRIFPTQRGRNLAAIIRNGGALGVSVRGFGDVDETGNVKPGYRLAGVDFVTDPSFNFHVGKECVMFESRSEEDDGAVTGQFGLVEDGPLAEQNARGRFAFALAAGYQGTFEQYSKDVLKN